MKKITFLFAFATIVAFSQTPQSYTGAADLTIFVNQEASVVSIATINTLVNRQPIVETYTDQAEFEDAYNADCEAALIVEDFTGGPGAITTCGPTLSSEDNLCFGAGVLEEGFVMTSEGTATNEVVFIPNGAIGNTMELVGSNSFPDYTIVSFPDENVFAVAHEIFSPDPNVEYRVYDINGDLIETIDLAVTANLETFFGFIADEPIGRIEIQGANDSGELIGNLQFGICNELSINDQLLSQAYVYPNPATEIININVPSSVEISGATIYDLLGKNTGASINNGAIDVSHLTKGIYILSVETTAGTLTQKVVKK